MSQALRGVKYKGKVKQLGICEWLGIRPFRPHDLRRTAAHLAQTKAQQPRWKIALCLDHQTDEDGHEVSRVTDEHYVQSQHMVEKLEVLTAWEAVLKDIITGKLVEQSGHQTTVMTGRKCRE
jgi:integrase